VIEIGGFTPLSTSDWPGRLCAVVFIRGCPWRCGYCHNPELQVRTGRSDIGWEAVRETLQRRVGLLDGVVFSGGEPTLDPELPAALHEVRALGFETGLHSAGIYPARLGDVLPLLSWVGLDVKTNAAGYDQLTGRRGSGRAACRALNTLLASGVAHELRTTYHPALMDNDALLDTAWALRAAGAQRWVLQRLRGVDDEATTRWPDDWAWPESVLDDIRALGLELTLR